MKKKKRTAGNGAETVDERDWIELCEELEARVIDVTPDMAARWLEKNDAENRTIAWRAVEGYANDMRAKNWKLTHQAIAFNEENLIDGQHRLHAVVQSKETVRMLVIRNTDGLIGDPVDRGRVRTLATLMGQRHSIVSTLNMLRQLEQGCPLDTPMTLSEAHEIFEHHKEALETLERTVPKQQGMTGPLRSALVWALPCEPDRVVAFAYKVQTGEMIQKGDPAFAFRMWKQKHARDKGWESCMAALNCARYFVHGLPLTNVYTGPMGYRAFVSRRRSQKVPWTPGVDLVTGVGWTPDAREQEDGIPEPEAPTGGIKLQNEGGRGKAPGIDPFRPRGAS